MAPPKAASPALAVGSGRALVNGLALHPRAEWRTGMPGGKGDTMAFERTVAGPGLPGVGCKVVRSPREEDDDRGAGCGECRKQGIERISDQGRNEHHACAKDQGLGDRPPPEPSAGPGEDLCPLPAGGPG